MGWVDDTKVDPISLLAQNQALDPPERYAAEWKSHSIFSVLATAAIGPALAAFLVFSRTLRSVANGQAVA